VNGRKIFIITEKTKQMNATLSDFKNTLNAILLMTLKKGGTSLNIQQSDSCAFMDLVWNPTVSITYIYPLLKYLTSCYSGRSSGTCKDVQDRPEKKCMDC
jgi:hypothetical protein